MTWVREPLIKTFLHASSGWKYTIWRPCVDRKWLMQLLRPLLIQISYEHNWMNENFLRLLHLLWVVLHCPQTSVSEVHPPPTHHVCGGLDEHLNWESNGCTKFHPLPHLANLIQTSKVHPRLRLHMNRIERLITLFRLRRVDELDILEALKMDVNFKTSILHLKLLSLPAPASSPSSESLWPNHTARVSASHITSHLSVLTARTTRFIFPTLPNLACSWCRHDSSFFPRSFALCFVHFDGQMGELGFVILKWLMSVALRGVFVNSSREVGSVCVMWDRCSDDDCVTWWAFHLLDPCCGEFSCWWLMLIWELFAV